MINQLDIEWNPSRELRSLQATRLPVARFQRFLARNGTFLYTKRKKMAIATSKQKDGLDYKKTDLLFELDDDDQV